MKAKTLSVAIGLLLSQPAFAERQIETNPGLWKTSVDIAEEAERENFLRVFFYCLRFATLNRSLNSIPEPEMQTILGQCEKDAAFDTERYFK